MHQHHSFITKLTTFAKVKELKGTGISIAHDLTTDDRIARKTLYKHLITARREQDPNAKIKGDKLLVDGNLLSIENLLALKKQVDGSSENSNSDNSSDQELDQNAAEANPVQ